MQDNIIVFPEPPSGDTAKLVTHALPVSLTSLIGREHEVQALHALLLRPDVRLLTLTGTAGVGKTRLALEVARLLVHDFADGVHVVTLAPISDPTLVIPTIAHSMGLTESGLLPLLDLLKTSQREKQQLLLLDNFEQVITAATLLVELLEACPDVKILVTSREVLRLQAEHLFTVPPLALPDPQHLPDERSLAHIPAVHLFIQRTQAIKSDSHVTTDNAATIAEICLRLDGLPLAIELAAARINLLPPQALLARLSQRLTVLTSGARDVPERQRTLRNTLAWSYQLLPPQEQRLFRRLSVFVGGCTLEAVEAVCATLDAETTAASVLDGVASLVDKSLLHQTEQVDGEPRYLMLETIREYGLECLQACGELEAVCRAHAAYYLRLAEAAEPQLSSAEQVQWLEQFEREHGNLQAALGWLITSEERELALRFGGALWQFWRRHGHLSEGYGFLERTLAASEATAAPIRAKALIGAGVLAGELGNYAQAELLCEEGLRLSRDLEDLRGITTSLWMLGRAAYHKTEYAVARSLVEEALAVSQQVGSSWEMAHALDTLTFIAYDEGKYEEACMRGEECLLHARRAGDNKAIRNALFILGLAHFGADSQVKGDTLLEEFCALARAAGDERDLAWALVFLGGLRTCVLDAGASGRTLMEEGMMHARRVGDQEVIVCAGYWQALDAFMQGDNPVARALLEECLTVVMREVSHRKLLLVLCLELLGEVVTAQGEPVWAARLWGAAETVRTSTGLAMPPALLIIYEQFTASVCTQLGEEAFQAALEEGRGMTAEQALTAQGPVTMSMPIPASLPSPPPTKTSSYPSSLTAREVEVLRLVAQGMTNEQMAKQLVISPRTVNTHLTSIFGKIGVSTRSAATRYAIDHHLI
jgi:predicted ATPase/DNA-binding CsgD family transcriptional regulator